MSNAYAQERSYEMSRNQQPPPAGAPMYTSRDSQLRSSSIGSFSRPREPTPPEQRQQMPSQVQAQQQQYRPQQWVQQQPGQRQSPVPQQPSPRSPPGQQQQYLDRQVDPRQAMSRPGQPQQQQYSQQRQYAQQQRHPQQMPRQYANPPNGPMQVANRGPPPVTIPPYSDGSTPSPRRAYAAPGPGKWDPDSPATSSFSSPVTSSYPPAQAQPPPPTDGPYSGPPSALPPIPPGSQPPKAPHPAPRSRVPLGPPPSSRRGPSSYYPQYPQQSYVSPIVEESDSSRNSERGSHHRFSESRTSYASSNAIPIGVSDYYFDPKPGRRTMDSYASEYDESDVDFPLQQPRPSRGESPPALLRQASVGKLSKPILTTINNARMGPEHRRALSDESNYDQRASIAASSIAPTLPPKSEARPPLRRIQNSAEFDTAARRAEAQAQPQTATIERQNSHPGRSSTDSEDSGISVYKMQQYAKAEPAEPKSAIPADSVTQDAILNSLAKGGALPDSDPKQPETQTTLSKRVGSKRPARINVDAVREAEKRGSLTSLPDLIRRATKLASNLDRGRTASRLGFGWMGEGDEKISEEHRRSGSLSDMISAFPPPAAVGTPVSRAGDDKYAWPSHLRNEVPDQQAPGNIKPERPRKRVCGMPVWVFLLVILLIVILIAAAVIVPVFLIVIPRQNQTTNNTTRSLKSCQTSLSCANGGVNYINQNGTCSCLCAGGHTGPTCDASAGSSCASISLSTLSDATIGSSLPAVLSASTNFSIPLVPETILSLLTSANSSCAAQNALVSFTGLSRRDLALEDISGLLDSPAPMLEVRQATTTITSIPAAATTAGVVFATDTPPGQNATSQQLAFAKVAVLFVLQDSGVAQGQAAQAALQKGIARGQDSVAVDGYGVDLEMLQVTMRNGTVVGG